MGYIANSMLIQAIVKLMNKGKKSKGHRHSTGRKHDASSETAPKSSKKES